jgi:Protein of unknown function (DUF3489)
MRTFTIDNQDNITAFASASDAGADPRFSTAAELLKLASSWPTSRLVEIWNSLTGVAPVRKFTDRNTAVSRIWKAIQRLDSAPAQAKSSAAKTGSKRAKPASAGAVPARTNSKKAQVLGLLQRPDGVTLRDLMAATDWQAHSVRGFLSGSLGKKMGLTVESFKNPQGERIYRVPA